VPVEFLSDAEAAAYGRFNGPPARAELERVFFLDDADRGLVDRHRGAHNRLGFALQLTTVRSLGLFLPDPLDVPPVVVAYVGEQLAIEDPSCVARYMERRSTRFEHADEIRRVFGLRDYAAAEEDLERWVDARAWTTGDGPRAIFDDAVAWLFERSVLLPGVTTLARLVARVRDEATQRLWETLSELPTARQRRMLGQLLVVAGDARMRPNGPRAPSCAPQGPEGSPHAPPRNAGRGRRPPARARARRQYLARAGQRGQPTGEGHRGRRGRLARGDLTGMQTDRGRRRLLDRDRAMDSLRRNAKDERAIADRGPGVARHDLRRRRPVAMREHGLNAPLELHGVGPSVSGHVNRRPRPAPAPPPAGSLAIKPRARARTKGVQHFDPRAMRRRTGRLTNGARSQADAGLSASEPHTPAQDDARKCSPSLRRARIRRQAGRRPHQAIPVDTRPPSHL